MGIEPKSDGQPDRSGWWQRIRKWLDRCANPIIAVSAVIMAGVTILALRDTRTALELDQRAWIAPGRIKILTPFERDKSREVWLAFGNTGKLPAQKVDAKFWPFAFPEENKIRDSDAVNAAIMKEMAGVPCANRSPNSEGGVIYPSDSGAYSYRILVGPDVVNQIIDTESYLVVAGCFTYETFGEPHYAAFCRFFDFNVADRKDSMKWLPSRCFVREYAN